MRVKLGDYIKEYSVKNKNNEDIPVYSVSNSLGFCKDYFGKEVASKNKTTYKIVPRGCFAYNPSRINVGSVDWQNEEERVIVSPLYNVFSVSPLLDQQYLLYYLKSNVTLSRIRAVASGSVRDNLKLSMLYEFPIDLISLDQQYEVVSILNTVQKIIDLYQKELSGLDELVRARFVEMFGNPVSNSKDLPVQKMNNVAPICQYDGSFEESVWLLNLDMVESQTGRIINYNIVSKDEIGGSVCTFDENNVLYSKLRPYLNKVVIPDGKGYATSELVPLRPDSKIIDRIYLAYLLRSNEFVEMIKEKVAGAKMPRVSMSDFREFNVPVPPLELQNQFASFVKEIDKSRLRELLAIKQIKLLLHDSWFLFY